MKPFLAVFAMIVASGFLDAQQVTPKKVTTPDAAMSPETTTVWTPPALDRTSDWRGSRLIVRLPEAGYGKRSRSADPYWRSALR